MRGLPRGGIGEGTFGLVFAAEEILVFEKPGLAERVDQVLLQPADLQIAGQANQMLAQIERAVRAVKIGQAFHQRRRNNQRRVGKIERIADQQAGLVRNRRRHEIERGAQASQHEERPDPKDTAPLRSNNEYLRVLDPVVHPREEYRSRLDRWRGEHARDDLLHRRLGNARLASGVLAVAIAALSLGAGRISPWWLLLPIVALAVLVVIHDRVDRALQRAARGMAYYERALARLENKWIGTGSQGERFRDPHHVFSDDLDLFGRGSLFELLSTARTGMGERLLAGWLLAPGEPQDVAARQEAVKELRPAVDLREDLALMGEDLRAALDDRKLGTWGTEPPVVFFAGARWIALVPGDRGRRRLRRLRCWT